MPIFSVIIPLFNKELYIQSCLDSLVNQTVNDFEVIVVNDGSTDNSLVKIDAYSEILDISVYSITNSGPAAARNYGVKKAKSNWICFLDADDEYLPNHLLTIKSYLGYSGRKVFCTNFIRGRHEAFIDYQGEFCTDFSAVFIGLSSPINSSNSCVDRDLFLLVGGFSENLRAYEDWHLWWRLISRDNFLFINSITSKVNLVDQSLSRRRDNLKELVKVRSVALKELKTAIEGVRESSENRKFYHIKINKIVLATLSTGIEEMDVNAVCSLLAHYEWSVISRADAQVLLWIVKRQFQKTLGCRLILS